MVAMTVGVAAILGAWMRWGVQSLFPTPWATVLVNAVGGLVMGWVMTRTAWPEQWRTVFTVGFLGALTTFSAFAGETLRLIQEGALPAALVNIVANNLLALGLCAVGFWLGRA